MFSATQPAEDHPWTEDPIVAYKNYLTYAGQNVNTALQYNRHDLTLFSPNTNDKKNNEIKLVVRNERFNPLQHSLSLPFYCSKLTIRNIEKASLRFVFNEDIISRSIGIKTFNDNVSKNINIAYRNIVPSEFAQTRSLAGPMGFHEYLIDGTNFKDNAVIFFVANSDPAETPLKIVLENCQGICSAQGLSADAVTRIFHNNCDEKNFKLHRMQLDEEKQVSNKLK